MSKYRIVAHFYLEGETAEEAEDQLYEGLNSELNTRVEVSDVSEVSY